MVQMQEYGLYLHALAPDCQSKKLLEMQFPLTGAAISDLCIFWSKSGFF
jgi:hypothetical protein